MRIDIELDLHGLRSDETRARLNRLAASPQWPSATRVRIIHGTGEVLHQVVRDWLDRSQVPWSPEPGNPGAVIARPGGSLGVIPRPKTARVPRKRDLSGMERSADQQAADQTDWDRAMKDLFGE